MQDQTLPDIETTFHRGVVLVKFNLVHLGPPEVERLREPLLTLASGDPPRLLLDLASVEYLCSVAIGVIIGMSRRVVEHGGRLVLCNLTTTAKETFMPLPSKQSWHPNWPGPFFSETLEEGLALCGDHGATA
jgi:anti-anti-sigma factor